MKRIIILGRGGAGKSTLARKLSKLTKIPYIELDKHFWQEGLQPTPHDEWIKIQEQLVSAESWIMDGDLGPHDVLDVRLQRADTVLVLDYPFLTCALRAARRSRERFDFWWWVFTWRRKSRPKLLEAIKKYAPTAEVHIFRNPKQLDDYLKDLQMRQT